MKLDYREWLLGLVIEFGTSNAIKNKMLDWNFLRKAADMEHMVAMDDDDFNHIAYVITPTAAKYLKENE